MQPPDEESGPLPLEAEAAAMRDEAGVTLTRHSGFTSICSESHELEVTLETVTTVSPTVTPVTVPLLTVAIAVSALCQPESAGTLTPAPVG